MSWSHCVRTSLVLALLGVLGIDAQGGVVPFSTRSSFNTATAGLGVSTTETFSSFAADTQISSSPGSPTSFSGFQASHGGVGGLTGFPILVQSVDVAPFTFSGGFSPNGSTYLVAAAISPTNPFVPGETSQTIIQPVAGTKAFGFDYANWGDNANDSELQITTSLGVFTLANPSNVDGFLGFHVTDPTETIQSMKWVPTAGSQGYDGIGIDDVVAVPEPSIWWLCQLVPAALLVRRNRRG